MLVMDHLDNNPVQVKDIERWTSHEPILSAVRHQVMSGWPNPDDSVEFKPYTSKHNSPVRLDVYCGGLGLSYLPPEELNS